MGICVVTFLLILLNQRGNALEVAYEEQFSRSIHDRNGVDLRRYSNAKGEFSFERTEMPERLNEFLISKEDRFFYIHPGINPFSMARALMKRFINGTGGGASTITQQLAKILLNNEHERTFSHKIEEFWSALALELRYSKKKLLTMYENVAYLGNQAQGFPQASLVYYNKPLEKLNETEILSLIATLGNPSLRNPWKKSSVPATQALAEQFHTSTTTTAKISSNEFAYQQPSFFELNSIKLSCTQGCVTTFDAKVQETLREILKRHIERTALAGATNGAIVVIKVPENELLALVGSPTPGRQQSGSEINMALQPRPIGSTVKPLLYLKGFETGLRPYTYVEDREYKYPIATGHPLYPKNFDGTYHGKITLHEALSNSLNVPSVKVLEHIGLQKFYNFMLHDLQFKPIQELDTYQYGIALGGLEMDLLTLCHYYTIFTNQGKLKPLVVVQNNPSAEISELPPQAFIRTTHTIASPEYVELVNKILSDRSTGVAQFGLTSNLNLTQTNVAVKTGTSRDFHDSWVVGYTPDFIVGVWLGNSENKALKQLSGASGAGSVWHDTMEYLFTTSYNKQTQFSFKNIEEFPIAGSIEYGLPNDILAKHQNILEEHNLILSPHTDDTFELTGNTAIPLEARESAHWSVNGTPLDTSKKTLFYPTHAGTYEIAAYVGDRREIIQIRIVEKQ